MIVELARLVLGLLIVAFHRPLADFILERERELATKLSHHGFFLPPFPDNKLIQDIYFLIGAFVTCLSLGRIFFA